MLYVMMGKSATGKDTIYSKLLKKKELGLKKLIPYTTRPKRKGEIDGQEYNFVDEHDMNRLSEAGKIIEHRCYKTVHGDWHYFTADNYNDVKNLNTRYITIGTLEAYIKLRDYYGSDYVIPIYVYVNDFERIRRSLSREKKQPSPNVTEVCRRYLADENDFSDVLLQEAKIEVMFENINVETCVDSISYMIQHGY